MTEEWRHPTLAELVDRARVLIEDFGRTLLGITGAPGAGKSTVARLLAQQLGPVAVDVPMDGFHLANAELVRLGRRDRKGAPDTFDSAGFVALLRRLRDPDELLVYAPEFSRDIEEPVAGALPVARDVPLVITEGNYLLLAEGRWADVRGLLDEVWYIEVDDDARLSRLVQRHVAYGKTPDAARSWSLGSDQRNAEIIAASRTRADLVVISPSLDLTDTPHRGTRGSGHAAAE